MSEPICTVMVGLPGLGKSTHIESERKLYARIGMGLFVYSTDAYIEEQVRKGDYASYDEAFEHCIDDATKAMNTELDKMIGWKNDVIFDQTNLGVGKRRKIINRMKQAGYQVRCICVVPPEEGHFSDLKDWKYRLANRPGKTIPNEVLSNMYKSFVMPTIEEGFDMITFYNMHGALLGIDYGEKE
jgi:tRNA uridine 5-carbamoylmethylation protein Kti12